MLRLRERLRPYIHSHLREGERTGIPLMRPLLLAFPGDEAAWEVEDQYLFGPDILVAPVTEFGARQRRVYLAYRSGSGRTPTPDADTPAAPTSPWTRRWSPSRCSCATAPTPRCLGRRCPRSRAVRRRRRVRRRPRRPRRALLADAYGSGNLGLAAGCYRPEIGVRRLVKHESVREIKGLSRTDSCSAGQADDSRGAGAGTVGTGSLLGTRPRPGRRARPAPRLLQDVSTPGLCKDDDQWSSAKQKFSRTEGGLCSGRDRCCLSGISTSTVVPPPGGLSSVIRPPKRLDAVLGDRSGQNRARRLRHRARHRGRGPAASIRRRPSRRRRRLRWRAWRCWSAPLTPHSRRRFRPLPEAALPPLPAGPRVRGSGGPVP